NPDGALKTYPGSAMIAYRLTRPADRLVLVEKHPGEYAELQKNFAGAKNAETAQADGFQLLADKVPFAERRGLVLADPSYEIKSEYALLPKQLARAFKKWPQGQFMLWYPLLPSAAHQGMLADLRKTDVTNMLVSEIRLDAPPEETFRMHGSGVIVVNPPFGFETALDELTRHITACLPAKAEASVFWLDNRRISPETSRLGHI
ncbi:MAG: 23S rRNA (adenine(2030)-N(6))-methyltransferase RlmJ, partial [Alphaproteobacteria bacterium]|nr:23S rRNA (adenine(2030)-N(6))-methyltransferase RlmJ [Alphaproteobacteria bacterium]